MTSEKKIKMTSFLGRRGWAQLGDKSPQDGTKQTCRVAQLSTEHGPSSGANPGWSATLRLQLNLPESGGFPAPLTTRTCPGALSAQRRKVIVD